MHIKKNDMVVVLSGKDKGKRGVVLLVSPKRGKVKVQGIAVVTRHAKARRRGEESQIKRAETFIPASRVMLFDAKANRPTRVASVVQDGKKQRVSKISQEVI
jgi:large subunit ribosomal protein L24